MCGRPPWDSALNSVDSFGAEGFSAAWPASWRMQTLVGWQLAMRAARKAA